MANQMASDAAAAPAPLAGATAVMGGRPEMEDAVTVQPNLCSPLPAAAFLRRLRWPRWIPFFECLQGEDASDPERGIDGESYQIEPPGYVSEKRALLKAWRLLLNRVFARTEKAALSICDSGKDLNCTYKINGTSLLSQMGTTAVALVVTEYHLVVVNCSDSHAVLYRSGRPIALSSDHKPTRSDEKGRIEACGGSYVCAAGDKYLKPWVTSEVELSLTTRGEDDEFVVIASDGLWDVIPNEMAGRVAAYCLRNPMSEDVDGCLSAASALTQLAIGSGSSDNISVIVVDLTRAA